MLAPGPPIVQSFRVKLFDSMVLAIYSFLIGTLQLGLEASSDM